MSTVAIILRLRRYLPRLWLAILTVLIAASSAQAATRFSPDEVKAVYLFNFANFVAWPASAFLEQSTPIRYCVLQESAVSKALATVVAGETAQRRPLEVIRVDNGHEAGDCHILFATSTSRQELGSILRQLAQAPVLTVTDFEVAGAPPDIELIQREGRIVPLIDTDRATKAGLSISSKLLRIASLRGDSMTVGSVQ